MMRIQHFIRAIFVCRCISVSQATWFEDLKSGKVITVAKDISVRVDEIANVKNPSSYFASHVLRIELADLGLSVAKANVESQEGLQFEVHTPPGGHSEQARGEGDIVKLFLPLMIGFKVAGTIFAMLIAVIVVSLKAFLASKAALLLSGSIALKKMWDLDSHDGLVHFPGEHSHAYDEYAFPSPSGYSHMPAPTSYGPTSHATDDSSISKKHSIALKVSNTVTPSVGEIPTLQTHMKRRMFKQKQPAKPILTLHKITEYQSK